MRAILNLSTNCLPIGYCAAVRALGSDFQKCVTSAWYSVYTLPTEFCVQYCVVFNRCSSLSANLPGWGASDSYLGSFVNRTIQHPQPAHRPSVRTKRQHRAGVNAGYDLNATPGSIQLEVLIYLLIRHPFST